MPAPTKGQRIMRDQVTDAAARARAGEMNGPVLLQPFDSRREAWQAAFAYAAEVRRLKAQDIIGISVRKATRFTSAGVYVERRAT
jgi:hypothetical protein